MKQTLQNQYLLIKEGKGHKDIFLKEAKSLFPNLISNITSFDQTVNILKNKNIISENFVHVTPISEYSTEKEDFELAFSQFLAEEKKEKEYKAEEKKPLESKNTHNNSDNKNMDNVIFDQLMAGYYIEMKKESNADKTQEDIKAIVLKNLQKDPIFYVTKGQFGLEDVGYEKELPGLGTPKEPKGTHKSSGYGDLNENISQKDYTSMSDSEIKKCIEDIGAEEFIVIDGEGGLANRDELIDIIKNEDVLEGIGKSYPDKIEGEYEGEPTTHPGIDLHGLLMDTLEIAISEDDFIKKIAYAVTDETSDISEKDKDKLRAWYRKHSKTDDNIVNENKLRSIIRNIIKEDIHKRLKEIDNEGIEEVKQSKISKLEAEIKKRQDQLDMIEDNEDLKELTDSKKIKSLSKEIKVLEKHKAKLEKSMKNKKEIIDETEDDQYTPEEEDYFPNMDDIESGITY